MKSINCPYRKSNGAEAVCLLVQQIAGVHDNSLCQASPRACECCVTQGPAEIEQPGAVVASLLFGLAAKAIALGGVPGCDAEKARALLEWSRRRLRPVAPSKPAASSTTFQSDERAAVACMHFAERLGTRYADGARQPVHRCRHPDHVETTPSECGVCPDCVRPPLAPSPPGPPAADWKRGESALAASALHQLIPPPPERHGSPVKRWAVGITTAPRRRPTLARTLETVVAAGWSEPRLFAEPEAPIPATFGRLPVTRRDVVFGAWPNFYLGLWELVLCDPAADAYLMLQDDVVFGAAGVRSYLESVLWPQECVFAVSLYTSKAYAAGAPGWRRFERKRWVWGACGFIWPRESALAFLTSNSARDHRRLGRHGGARHVDVVIGKAAVEMGMPIYHCVPSLLQHIGETSTLWTTSRATGLRRASSFIGDVLQSSASVGATSA